MSDALIKKDQAEAQANSSANQLAAFTGIGGLTDWKSFDPRTPEGAKMMLQANLGTCLPLGEHIGKSFNLTHVYAHQAESADDETGLVQKWNRIVLWDDQGNVYDCGSLGVAKSVGLIAQSRGLPPFDPPVKVTIQLRKLGGKKQWLYLDPDIDSLLDKNGHG